MGRSGLLIKNLRGSLLVSETSGIRNRNFGSLLLPPFIIFEVL